MTRAPERMRTALQEQWARPEWPVVGLHLPFPISTNRLWRHARGRVIRSERYRVWKQAAGAEINMQKVGGVRGPFRINVKLEYKVGHRRIDADNGLKCVLDILQEYGIIENDRLAIEVNVSWSSEINGTYVVITSADPSSLSPAKRVA